MFPFSVSVRTPSRLKSWRRTGPGRRRRPAGGRRVWPSCDPRSRDRRRRPAARPAAVSSAAAVPQPGTDGAATPPARSAVLRASRGQRGRSAVLRASRGQRGRSAVLRASRGQRERSAVLRASRGQWRQPITAGGIGRAEQLDCGSAVRNSFQSLVFSNGVSGTSQSRDCIK